MRLKPRYNINNLGGGRGYARAREMDDDDDDEMGEGSRGVECVPRHNDYKVLGKQKGLAWK